ncbi:hypothetical protein [Streptomyces sp. SID14515]|uniref:hypothetical protein n=1 Tax=Streptomyces sp. SID14515 TaxID=2706074 RepID=UPI0013C8E8C8|nr:hypothetical protein [Streptomyces sp. SID14515]NEB39358.1 hypothetical protein [Streptomyces sp. SID14515]
MKRILGPLAIAVALGAALTTAPAAAATPETVAAHQIRAKAAGVWTGTVAVPDGTVEVTMSFHPNGTVCLVEPPPGPDGGAEGSGTWTRTGPATFSFRVTERFFDGSGATVASLRATHRATLQGANAFTTVGKASYYDPAGNVLATFATSSSMQRTQQAPTPSCP